LRWYALRHPWLALKRWLCDEPRGLAQHVHLILSATAGIMIWSLALMCFTILAGKIFTSRLGIGDYFSFFWAWYKAAFIEEFVFRWLPLAPLLIIFRKRAMLWLMVASVYSSIFFGTAHYSYYEADWPGLSGVVLSLLNQGVGGFVWCLVFIRCARKADYFFVRPILTTTTGHFLFNMMVIAISREVPSTIFAP